MQFLISLIIGATVFLSFKTSYSQVLNTQDGDLEELADLDEISLLDIRDLSSWPAELERISIQLLKHKNEHQDLSSLYELIQLDSLDIDLLRSLWPKLKAVEQSSIFRSHGVTQKSRILIRSYIRDGALSPSFYSNYRCYNKDLRYGFAIDQDIDEQWAINSKVKGFDHYSGFLEINRRGKRLSKILLGDYHIAYGRGLNLNTGFNVFHRSEPLNNSKFTETVKFFNGSSESNYLRGSAIRIHLGAWSMNSFISHKKIDARIQNGQIRSFDHSGYHSDSLRLSRKNNTSELIIGNAVKWQKANLIISMLPQYRFYKNEINKLNAEQFTQGLYVKYLNDRMVIEIESRIGSTEAAIDFLGIRQLNKSTIGLLHINRSSRPQFKDYMLSNSTSGLVFDLSLKHSLNSKLSFHSSLSRSYYDENLESKSNLDLSLFKDGRKEAWLLRFRLRNSAKEQQESIAIRYRIKSTKSMEINIRQQIGIREPLANWHRSIDCKTSFGKSYLVIGSSFYNLTTNTFYSFNRDVLYYFSTSQYSKKGSELYALVKLSLNSRFNFWTKLLYRKDENKKSWTLRAQLIYKFQ